MSGVVNTVGYELSTGVALSSSIYQIPSNCFTAPHVAGNKEMAFISMGFQSAAMGPNNIQLAPFYTENNSTTATRVGVQPSKQSVGLNTYGTAFTVASMALTEGVTYRFYTGILVSNTMVPLTDMVCRAVVVIAKRP